MVVDVKKIVDRKINMMQLVLASEMSYLYYLYKENCPLRLRNKEEIVVMRHLNKKMTLPVAMSLSLFYAVPAFDGNWKQQASGR